MPGSFGEGADPFGDAADGYAAGAFGLPGFVVVDPGGAGDVEVDPGDERGFAYEFFEEHGGGGGSGIAAAAGVHDVGDLGFDLVAVVVGAGHAPEFFAGEGEGVGEALRGCVVIREEAGVDEAERDADGSGEGGGVDEVGGAEGLGVVEAVGEDEAAFGVGVHDLDGLAGHGGDDVAGFEGAAVGHVFAGADDAEDADVGLELGDGSHGSDHGGGTGHVVLHLVHVVGGLDGDASGVEGDAFADEAEDGGVSGGVGWLVAHDDEGWLFGGALGYGGEGSHLELEDFVDGVDFALEAELLRHGGRAAAEFGGGEDVAGLVDEGAGEVLGLGEELACVEGSLDFWGRGGMQDCRGGDAQVFAVGAVEVDVEVGDDGAFGEGAGGERGGERGVLGEGEGEVAEGAGFGETDGDAGSFADFVRSEGFGFAEADDEETLGFEARGGVEEEGLAEGGFELAGGEPGSGGGEEGGVGGEEGGGCGGVFDPSGGRCGGVDGEDGEERGGEVGGGEGLELDVHLFRITRGDGRLRDEATDGWGTRLVVLLAGLGEGFGDEGGFGLTFELDGVGHELGKLGAVAGEELPADDVVALEEAAGGAVEGEAVLIGLDGAGEGGGGVAGELVVGGCAHLGSAEACEGLGEGRVGDGTEFGGGRGGAEAGSVHSHNEDHAEAVAGVGGGDGQGDAVDGGFGDSGGLVLFGFEGFVSCAGHGSEGTAVGVVEMQEIAVIGGGGGGHGGLG